MSNLVNHAIHEIRERAVSLKGQIPIQKLPTSFHRIAFDVTNELDKVIQKLDELLQSPKYQIDENIPYKVIRLQELFQTLDYIENNVIVCLDRWMEKDERMTCLVQKICREIVYPLVPPTATLISQDYYFIDIRFYHIRIPLLESNFLLHLPILYHEICHPIISTRNHPKIADFQHKLAEFYYQKEQLLARSIIDDTRNNNSKFQQILKIADHCWISWGIEFFCDLFAIYTSGPAFAWSYLFFCIKSGSQAFDLPTNKDSTHPSDDARLCAMMAGLRLIGLHSDAKQLETEWKAFLKKSFQSKDAKYKLIYPTELLEHCAVFCLEGVKNIGCNIYNPDSNQSITMLLNEAWCQFLNSSPSEYFSWEKQKIAILNLIDVK